MSARMRKPGSLILPLMFSALSGVILSLLICALLAVAVYRGALGEQGSGILTQLCPILGSSAAALRSFAQRDTALLKHGALLLLLSTALYLPLLLLFSGEAFRWSEFFSLILRCLCGIVLGSVCVLRKSNKSNRRFSSNAFKGVKKKQ